MAVMTTILADARLGVMVADTGATDGDRQWVRWRKVWRVRGALVGFAGDVSEAERMMGWIRGGMQGEPPPFEESEALILCERGLWTMQASAVPSLSQQGRDAIGTGAKAAMAAYEALGWTDPARAVRIACNHDLHSRPPVRSYVVRGKPK